MNVRCLAASLLCVLIAPRSQTALGQEANPPPAAAPAEGKMAETGPAPKDAAGTAEGKLASPRRNGLEVATFGGGCFWCTEAVCEAVPGVVSAVSGYSGGSVPFPTYDAVCSDMTGHAEVVQVVFNPAVISYEKLVEVFFRSHDPTTPNAQGPDVGTQYRSIILYHNEDQRKAALEVYQNLKARRVLKGTVVTQLVPFVAFFPAEAYHQDYYQRHPLEPYSIVYIEPKFDVLWKMNILKQPKSRKRRVRHTQPASGAHPVAPGEADSAAATANGPRGPEPTDSDPARRDRAGRGLDAKSR